MQNMPRDISVNSSTTVIRQINKQL